MADAYRTVVTESWQRYPLAMDSSPAEEVAMRLATLGDTWLERFEIISASLADHWADSVWNSVDLQLYQMVQDMDFEVHFRISDAVQNCVDAIVAENINLIKSIPQEYHKNITAAVMESLVEGRNVRRIYKELTDVYGVTKRRAKLIAFDQTNKATSAINKVRQKELGVTHAIWRHSHTGRHPRPEHIKANGKTYDIDKGMFLEGKWTWPGREINCRCTSESIFPWRKSTL